MKNVNSIYLYKLVLIALLLTTLSPFNSTADELHFVSIEGLIEQEIGEIVLPQLYEKIGYTVLITPVPGRRAQQLATSGSRDGEIMRIWTYGVNNPSVIRVPTPYYTLETMAFIRKDRDLKIHVKDDLLKYKIAKVRGVKHTDNIVENIPKAQVFDVRSTKNAMLMLLSGRVDIVLTNTNDGLLVVKEYEFTEITPSAQPLRTLNLYHYIHESKAYIVPKIDALIQEMTDNGELLELLQQAEKIVLENQ